MERGEERKKIECIMKKQVGSSTIKKLKTANYRQIPPESSNQQKANSIKRGDTVPRIKSKTEGSADSKGKNHLAGPIRKSERKETTISCRGILKWATASGKRATNRPRQGGFGGGGGRR